MPYPNRNMSKDGRLPDEIQETYIGELPMPSGFTVNLTHRCNLACNMCTQYGGKFKNDKAREISADQWGAFFKDVAWVQPKITLFGGEPTVYPHFEGVIRKLRDLGMQFDLVTNGYFLGNHVPALIEGGAGILISIDGTSETHNAIRNSSDSFERIEAALQQIKVMRQERRRTYLGLNLMLLPENIDNLEEFLEFALDCDPDLITLQHPQYSDKNLNRITDAVWRRHLSVPYTTRLFPKTKYSFDPGHVRKLRRAIEAVKGTTRYEGLVAFFPDFDADELPLYYSDLDHFFLKAWHTCEKPWTRPTIDPNGDVSLCLDYFVGNITTDNFWEVWDNKIARKLRRSLTAVERFPVCSRCCEFYSIAHLTS